MYYYHTFIGLRTALFRVITQRAVVIPYRRFGTIYLSHLQAPPIGHHLQAPPICPHLQAPPIGPIFKRHLSVPSSSATYLSPSSSATYRSPSSSVWGWGQTGCPETSVWNYYYSLRNNPKERSSQLLRRRSLISRVCSFVSIETY